MANRDHNAQWIGERFGRLTLLRVLPDRVRYAIVGLWRCDCGAEKRAIIAAVRTGHLKSCGCLRTKHGYGSTRGGKRVSDEYRAWQAMHARCSATKGDDAKHYRARGITVCARWREFPHFLTDMGLKPTSKHSLDRRDNDKGYSPDNCRWGTSAQQLRNTSRSRIWEIRGETFDSVRDAAKRFGVDQKTIRYWVKTQKDDCRAFSRY